MKLPAGTLLVLATTLCCGASLIQPRASADKPAPQGVKGDTEQPRSAAIAFDVTVEEVDLARNTLTATSYCHVIPPSGRAGGAVFFGNLPPGAKPARYERLPVMPEAGLKEKGLRRGMRATLRLAIVKGAAVVVRVEPVTDPERLGIDWLDAPAPPVGMPRRR
jgi:hypothetical protein